MDFRLGEQAEAFRAEARAFLDAELTPEILEQIDRTGVSHDDGFATKLSERGWLAPGWPVEWGGQGRDPMEVLAFSEELGRSGAPSVGVGTTMAVSKVIHVLGTDSMKREILPKAMKAEIIMVLGFSEPESGSDVAAAQCRAVRDGDEWVINGPKMFTTNAHIADYVFLLTRTNTEVAKHKGLTTFLVPLHGPGIEVQGVFTMSGERTNLVFFTDVRVADKWRVGDVDGGWTVMTKALQDEHSAAFGLDSERLLVAAETWAERTGQIADSDVRRRLARAATEVEVARLLERRTAWMTHEGIVAEAEAPMSKLFSSESLVRQSEDLAEMMGPDALRTYLSPTAPDDGVVEFSLRFAPGTTTYAGTSEIQRMIISQRGLGLPRAH